MIFSRLYQIFFYFFIISWITPKILMEKVSLILPFSEKDIKDLTRGSLMKNFFDFANIVNFRYEVFNQIVKEFNESSPEKKEESLNSKDKIRNTIVDLGKSKELYIDDYILDHLISMIISEFKEITEGRSEEQKIQDKECHEYHDKFNNFMKKKCEEVLEEMEELWNSSNILTDVDLTLKEEKWNLWVQNYEYYVSSLIKNYDIFHINYIHSKNSANTCGGIYEYLENSFVNSYRGPLLIEFNNFFLKFMDEWESRKDLKKSTE